jgi:hypothetical protein
MQLLDQNRVQSWVKSNHRADQQIRASQRYDNDLSFGALVRIASKTKRADLPRRVIHTLFPSFAMNCIVDASAEALHKELGQMHCVWTHLKIVRRTLCL